MATSSMVPVSQVLIPTGSARVLPGDANVTPELQEAGKSFGSLLKTTGNAIALSQRKLNETSANSAIALSNTVVNVIAVRETVYDDDGEITTPSNDIIQKLPLVNFMDPVFYEWPEVHVQGLFMATEISSGVQASSQATTTTGVGTQAGLSIKLGRLSLFGYERQAGASSTTQGSTMTAQASVGDYAFGNIRLNARLTPKTDVGVPKPRQIIRGPKLAFAPANPTDDTATPATFRTLDLTIQYNQQDGSTPITGQAVWIESDGTGWTLLPNDKSSTDNAVMSATDGKGRVNIRLKRMFPSTKDDKGTLTYDNSYADAMVTARVGMVTNTIVVRL